MSPFHTYRVAGGGEISPARSGAARGTLRQILAVACMLLGAQVAMAQSTFYWDGDGSGTVGGGTGNWNTTDTRWSATSGGNTYSAWLNTAPTDHAVFQNTAGTVTVNAAVTVRTITFGSTGYTITRSASNVLTLDTTGSIDTGANNATISAVMGGTVGMTKLGAGTLTLSGTNTYTGATTISAGTITMGASNVFADTSTMVINGGTLDVNTRSDTLGAVTLNSGSITGTTTGTLTIGALNIGSGGGTSASIATGTSTLRLGGNLTYLGTGNPNAATISGLLSLGTANRTFTINDSTATASELTISAEISQASGARAVSKDGAGTLILSGNNTYDGRTTVSAGILTLSGSNTGAAGGVRVTGGTLNLNNANAAGSGTLELNGGTLDNTSGGAITLTNTAVTLGGNFAFTGTNNLNIGAGAVNLSGNRTLTINGGSLTIGGIISQSGGNRALTKAGAGTLVLNGDNTYDGLTTLSAGTLTLAGNNSGATGGVTLTTGTLNINNANALGTGTFTINGGTINNTSGGAITNAGNNAQTWGGDFAFTGSNNLNLGTGPVTLSNNRVVTANAGNLTVGGNIGGAFSLTKAGAGTLTLSGSNNYSGGTNINAGTLALGSSGALGTTGTISFGGGTLQYSASNTTDYTARFSNAAGQAYTIDTNGPSVTFGTALTSSGGTLTKLGTGALTLNVANSYTGNTTINGGTLRIAADDRLGTAPGSPVANSITLGGGSLEATNTFTLNSNRGVTLTTATTSNITANNTHTLTYGGAMTGSGNVTFGTASTGTGTVVLSGASTNSGTVAIDYGTVQIQNSTALGNGSAGTTVASGATLQLQGSIAAGNGTLSLAGTGVGGNGALVNVTGVNNQWTGNITINGAATKINAGADFGQTMILGTATSVPSRPFGAAPTNNSILDLGNNTLTLTSTGTTQIRINSEITGTGNLVVDLDNVNSVVRLNSVFNTYTGTTTVNNGTLRVRTAYNSYPNDPTPGWENYFGINGPLVIGNASNGAGTAVVDLLAGTTGAEVLNFTTDVTINASGKLLAQSAQSIRNLTFNGGGQVDLTTDGSLFLDGVVTVNPTAGQTATISGTSNSFLSLTIHNGNPSSTDRSFVVNGGAGNLSDLTISTLINDGGFTKTGTGTMTITSNNSTGYGGQSKVNNGILNVQHSNALGQGAGLDAKGTVVGNGGTLQLQATANGDDGIAANADDNKLTFTSGNNANEKLFLNGNGFGGNGALNSKNGTNTWGGNIDVQTSARIQTDADLLTLAGTITSSTDANLDVRGSGNTTISGDISTGTGGLTKNGTGTLILSGNNTFHGATTITTGIVSVQHNNGLGATTAGTTVADTDAALHLDNTAAGGGSNVITVGTEALSIAGTGVGGTGALYNASGNNTYGGQITIANTATIAAVTGSTLTLSGGTTSTAGNTKTLTVGTAGATGDIVVSSNMSNGASYSTAVNLTKAGAGDLAINGATNTVGAVNLSAGTMHVGDNSTVNTGAFASSTGTTLTIASGGYVDAHFAAGTETFFSGSMVGDGAGANGTFRMTGASDTAIFTLNNASGFNASNLTLVLNGGTLKLTGGGDFVFNRIEITGNTILDFDSSWGTSLSSTSLVISGGASVTVKNWVHTSNNAAQSTIWYATGTVGSNSLTGSDINGTSPLNQITFQGYPTPTYTTTWTDQSTAHNGWFDREIRPTPEPATYGALFLSASLGLFAWRRFRQSKRQ